jgi:diacylglycerol O-acyltransferase
MTRLDPLSYAFLAAEDVDPTACLVIGSVAVLDGPPPSLDELRAVVGERLAAVPRYRQRIRPDVLGLRPPRWEEDPSFDVSQHVLAAAVPSPGGPAELGELVSHLMTLRMDRAHPLWEVWRCEGLPDDRWAVVSRVHHTLADGVSGTALHRVLFDPEGQPRDDATVPSAPAPSAVPRLGRSGLLDTAVAAVRGSAALGGALLPVHGSSLLGRLVGHRRYAWTQVDLRSAAAARELLGVTVNDLVLAAAAGGLRELLLHRGQRPDRQALRSLVPVSAHLTADAGPGNEVTLMLMALPVDVEDPVERVRAVHERIVALRRSGEPEAGLALQSLARRLPFPVVGWVVRQALRVPQRQVSTVTTNVPGPRRPMSCLGREVRELLPYVPIADRVRVGIAVLSYAGTLCFGLTGDAAAAADLDVLAEGIRRSWADVLDRVASSTTAPAVRAAAR